jgi:cell division protein FtsW
MISREQRTPLSEWWWTVDRLLLAAIIALMLAGVILSLAASPPVATRIGLDPFHFFNRHILFLVPSIIVLIGVSFMTPRQIRRSALVVFAISIVLILATLLIGPEVKGAKRWITILGINIQASESAAGIRGHRRLAVLGIRAQAGNAGDLHGHRPADDAGVAAGDAA